MFTNNNHGNFPYSPLPTIIYNLRPWAIMLWGRGTWSISISWSLEEKYYKVLKNSYLSRNKYYFHETRECNDLVNKCVRISTMY